MPDFHVSANIRINSPLEEVRKVITDFNSWPIWSPWLRMEPGAQLEYEGLPDQLGHGYRWQGEKVGSGEMVWTDLSPTQLDAKLTFLKPFKSKADVGFTLTDAGGATDVEWVMDSGLPFFMFFMVKTMKGMITMDYTRGLTLLKDFIEQGEIVCDIDPVGVVDSPAYSYLGITEEVPMSEIGEAMGRSFSQLKERFAKEDVSSDGLPFSVYQTMDVANSRCRYTAAMPVNIEDAENTGALEVGEILMGTAFKVVYTGPYRHIGNAWALAMSDMRHQKLKASKRCKPYERYVNDPTTTPENNLVTEIFIPLR